MSEPIIALDRVVAGYGAMTILHGTTFTVERGAITTVIGPNGAGKSTVFRAIFGLLPLRSGTIRIDGTDTAGMTPRDLLAAGVVYVPQGRNIFPELSVEQNLELGLVSAKRPAAEERRRVEAVLARFPTLRRKARQQASTLSGGEQKQLEVARGLLLDPKVVLIDEPSIGLSPMMVQDTFRTLMDLRDRGVSILMIEQNARSALQISDYGLVLELGQARMSDTAAAILADPRVGRLFLGGALEQRGP